MLLIHHKNMKENEMEKPFTDILDREDINQLNLLFILDREETNSLFLSVMSDFETDQSLLLQKDFLMHNSLNIKDKKD